MNIFKKAPLNLTKSFNENEIVKSNGELVMLDDIKTILELGYRCEILIDTKFEIDAKGANFLKLYELKKNHPNTFNVFSFFANFSQLTKEPKEYSVIINNTFARPTIKFAPSVFFACNNSNNNVKNQITEYNKKFDKFKLEGKKLSAESILEKYNQFLSSQKEREVLSK